MKSRGIFGPKNQDIFCYKYSIDVTQALSDKRIIEDDLEETYLSGKCCKGVTDYVWNDY